MSKEALTNRAERVAHNIKEEVGWMLEKGEAKDPRIGFVTITDVDVSPDMHRCTVYFSFMGKKADREKTKAGLDSAVPFIRGELGRRLRLKYVPELEFKYDPTVAAGARIAKLLRDIHSKEDRDD